MGCRVCDHESRADIEASDEEPGADLNAVAERFRVTVAAIEKHRAHPRTKIAALPPRSRTGPTTEPSARARLPRVRRTTGARAPREAPPAPVAARRRDLADGRPRDASPPELEASPPTSRSAELEGEISGRAIAGPRSAPPRVAVARHGSARDKVERLVDDLQALVDDVRRDPEAGITAKVAVIRANIGGLALLGKLTGELGASETTVASSPFYRRVKAAIVEALRPFPEAALAVADALARTERGPDLEAAAE